LSEINDCAGFAKVRSRIRQNAGLLFLLLSAIVLVPLCGYYNASYTLNRDWAEAEAEAGTLDARWRLMDIEADAEPRHAADGPDHPQARGKGGAEIRSPQAAARQPQAPPKRKK
jgi:hypothetical protein